MGSCRGWRLLIRGTRNGEWRQGARRLADSRKRDQSALPTLSSSVELVRLFCLPIRSKLVIVISKVVCINLACVILVGPTRSMASLLKRCENYAKDVSLRVLCACSSFLRFLTRNPIQTFPLSSPFLARPHRNLVHIDIDLATRPR